MLLCYFNKVKKRYSYQTSSVFTIITILIHHRQTKTKTNETVTDVHGKYRRGEATQIHRRKYNKRKRKNTHNYNNNNNNKIYLVSTGTLHIQTHKITDTYALLMRIKFLYQRELVVQRM